MWFPTAGGNEGVVSDRLTTPSFAVWTLGEGRATAPAPETSVVRLPLVDRIATSHSAQRDMHCDCVERCPLPVHVHSLSPGNVP